VCPSTPVPRTRGTRVPATGTGMRRVGYGFEKKPVYPCPPYPSTRRTRARPTRRPPRVYPARTRGTRRQITSLISVEVYLRWVKSQEYLTHLGLYYIYLAFKDPVDSFLFFTNSKNTSRLSL
jgi:hypothetical protein